MSDTTVQPASPPVRRTRPLLAWVGAILALGGAFLLPFLVAAARTTDPSEIPGVDAVAGVIVVGMFGVAPLGLGLWLLYAGVPTLPARLRSAASKSATTGFWLAVWTWLIGSSLGRTTLGAMVVVAGAIVLPRGARWAGAFAAITAYSVLDPLVNAFRPRWWVHTVQSLAGWIVLFMFCGGISEADRLGEDAMVFLFPVMLYPGALGLSGVLRLMRWKPRAPGGGSLPTVPRARSTERDVDV